MIFYFDVGVFLHVCLSSQTITCNLSCFVSLRSQEEMKVNKQNICNTLLILEISGADQSGVYLYWNQEVCIHIFICQNILYCIIYQINYSYFYVGVFLRVCLSGQIITCNSSCFASLRSWEKMIVNSQNICNTFLLLETRNANHSSAHLF